MNTALSSLTLLWHTKPGERKLTLHYLGILMFLCCMIGIFTLTGISPLSGFHTNIKMTEISLIPFQGIREISATGLTLYALANILGNILLFIPIGFFLPVLWKNFQSFGKTLATGLCISLLIECSQLFLNRGTDIDDLLLNTAGAAIGYLCYIIFRKLFPVFSKQFAYDAFCRLSVSIPYLCMLTPYAITVIVGFISRAVYLAA